jgi:hypothetical protein
VFPAFSNSLNDTTSSFSLIDFAVNGFNKVACIVSKTSSSTSKKSSSSANVEIHLFTWSSTSLQQSSSSSVYLDLTNNDSLNHIPLVVSENVKKSSAGSHEFSLFGHSYINSFSVFISSPSASPKKWMKYNGNGNILFEREILAFPSEIKESEDCVFVLSSDNQQLLLLDIRYGKVLSTIPLISSSKQQLGNFHLFAPRSNDVGLLSQSSEDPKKLSFRSVDIPSVTPGLLSSLPASSHDLPSSSSFNHKLKLSENSAIVESFSKEIEEKIRNDIYYFIQKVFQEEYLLLEGKGKDVHKQIKRINKLKPFHSTVDQEIIQVRYLLPLLIVYLSSVFRVFPLVF